MSNQNQIHKKYTEFRNRPYPEEIRGKDINDICLVTLEFTSVGCIDSFFPDDRLGENKLKILKLCLDDIDQVLITLESDAREHFTLLKEICVEIVRECKK